MVDQSKRFDLGKAAPVTAGNEGDTEAVKAGIDSCTSKQRVNSTILITREIARRALAAIEKERQRRSKAGVNRHGKILSWIILLSLCISQPNSSACQVDIFHWDRALRKPAPSVERNLETSPHPFRLICELGPDFGNLGISQFWFHSLRRSSNPESGNRVGLGELSSDGFIDELGEEFYLKQGCVMDDFLSVDSGRQSPANVRPAMRVSHLPRVDDALLVQERSDGLPGDRIASSGVSLALPVGCDIAGHPRSESRGAGRPADSLFFDRGFIGQPLSFSGISGVVDSEAGGLFNPQTGVQIAPAEVPERGAFLLPQMRHSARVVQSRSFVKWINGDAKADSVVRLRVNEYYGTLPLHYEAPLFPAENSQVVQESLISGCFLSRENTGNRRFGKEGEWPL